MTREQIITLASEAGISVKTNNTFADGCYIAVLYRFGNLVAAAEREEILDLVDGYAKGNSDLVDAIKARGEQ